MPSPFSAPALRGTTVILVPPRLRDAGAAGGVDRTRDCRDTAGRPAAVVLAALAALVIASSSPAATKPPVGWTTDKAAAQVKAKVRLPWCRYYEHYESVKNECSNGRPTTAEARAKPSAGLGRVQCRGVDGFEIGETSRFRQLRCDWEDNNSGGHSGRLYVYVTGKSTFRWKAA